MRSHASCASVAQSSATQRSRPARVASWIRSTNSARLSGAANYVADFTAAGERAAREARLNRFHAILPTAPTANNNQPRRLVTLPPSCATGALAPCGVARLHKPYVSPCCRDRLCQTSAPQLRPFPIGRADSLNRIDPKQLFTRAAFGHSFSEQDVRQVNDANLQWGSPGSAGVAVEV
jgi:hypothetical protein